MNQQSWTPMLAPTLLVLGIASICLGWGWNAVVPSSAYWGPEQGEEYIAAQTELHGKTHSQARNENHESEFAAARDRFIKISEQLDAAQATRNRTGSYIVGAGILLIFVGIYIHLATRPTG